MLKKLGLAMTFVGFSLAGNCVTFPETLYTDITTRAEFASAGQKGVQFITTAPKFRLIKYDNATKDLLELYCKINEENSTVLRAIKQTVNPSARKKEDHTYEGYRDTRVEVAFENFLRFLKLYSPIPYTETPLVTEYFDGIPMIWAFKNIDDLHAIISYLKKNLGGTARSELENVESVVVYNNPLLSIDFVESESYGKFTEDDIAFLTRYFAVLNPCDEKAATFVDKIRTTTQTALDYTAGAKNIKESYGEEIFRLTEEFCGGTIRAQDLLIKGFVLGVGYKIGSKVFNNYLVDKPAKKLS